jgi:hypothetical protein
MFVKDASGPDGVPLTIRSVEPVSMDVDYDERVRDYGSLPEATPLVFASDDQSYSNLKDMIKEAPRFRDLPFLILFLVHLAIIVGLAIAHGRHTTELFNKIDYNVSDWQTLVDDDTTSEEVWKQFEDVLSTARSWVPVHFPRILNNIILPSALVAYFVSYIWTAAILPAWPTAMVVTSLFGSIALALVLTITVGMASGFKLIAMLLCGLAIAGAAYYVASVWRLIPFAAVNLSVALRGISANCGMYIVAFIFSIVGIFWTLLWVCTVVGCMQARDESYQAAHPRPADMSKEEYSFQEEIDSMDGFVMFAFLVSLYWTSQALLVRYLRSNEIDSFFRHVSSSRERLDRTLCK